MDVKHTPGPWTNHGRIPQNGLPHAAVAAKTLIARVYSEAYGDIEQETANAHLIAASPDLLAAAQAAEAIFAQQKWAPDSPDPEAVALRLLRAAIAKATGSQP